MELTEADIERIAAAVAKKLAASPGKLEYHFHAPDRTPVPPLPHLPAIWG